VSGPVGDTASDLRRDVVRRGGCPERSGRPPAHPLADAPTVVPGLRIVTPATGREQITAAFGEFVARV
jgi:hypothetical protein